MNKRRVKDIVKEFTLVCRGLHGTEYAAEYWALKSKVIQFLAAPTPIGNPYLNNSVVKAWQMDIVQSMHCKDLTRALSLIYIFFIISLFPHVLLSPGGFGHSRKWSVLLPSKQYFSHTSFSPFLPAHHYFSMYVVTVYLPSTNPSHVPGSSVAPRLFSCDDLRNLSTME